MVIRQVVYDNIIMRNSVAIVGKQGLNERNVRDDDEAENVRGRRRRRCERLLLRRD